MAVVTSKNALSRLFDAAVLCSIAIALYPRIETTRFHIDEVAWIGYGYYYHLLFEEHVFSGADWESYPARCDFPAGKYFFGLGLKIQGKPVNDLSVYNTFGRLWNDPFKLLDAIPPDLLFAGRKVAWLFATIAVFFMYIFVSRAAGRLGGAIVVPLILLNPVSVVFSQALSDSILLAGLAGGGLLVSSWRPTSDSRRFWIIAIATGAITGLATAVKANGAMIGIYFAIAVVVWLIVSKENVVRKNVVLASALAGIAAFVVFFIVNPALYHDPFSSVAETLRIRADAIAEQQRNIGPPIIGAWKKFFMVAWRTLIAGPYLAVRFMGIASIIGAVLLLRQKDERLAIHGKYLVLWSVTLYALTTAWIPLDWDRYYLPAAAGASCLAAAGAGIVVKKCYAAIRSRITSSSLLTCRASSAGDPSLRRALSLTSSSSSRDIV